MDSAFRIVEKCRRPNKKFNSEEAIFQVIVDPDRWLMSNGAPTIGQTTDAIRTLFETLLRRVTSSLEPTDLMRSKSEVLLDEGFNLEIITIRRPEGSGKTNRRVIIPSLDRLRKKSMWCVPDDDLNICCAEALLLAIAEVEKDVDLRSLRRKDCDLLKRRAIALHQKTGVHRAALKKLLCSSKT
ncbi:uncharacterized protein NPIL_535241 [Nephila pilipes]|uniref:Uncharacterized protein n=1 Tax=Nephila pilipes TaxID=299642 RepID=A0A8X6Q438_NEPPI|nr:uncharacterized protein NPIL_535241 [Nephila pilipes]